ncbi:putative F-box protein [Raphanus sativus]|uniref:F-box protein At1g46984 n=1 Tax=Raphanus sativus TaxID=3726 RepID=A0A6J0LQW0_RAPSA|nr:putative F-box protein At1g46984 [Raphanus sativus]KAJ4903020.1 putative F-box protein [Raphanus sativus]
MGDPENRHLKIARHNIQLPIKTIPNELIFEIISRLPAESIAICRRIWKEWESLLRTPDFTNYFLAVSSAHPRILLTFKYSGKWHFFSTPQPQDLDKELSVVEAFSHMKLNGGSGPESCLSVQGFTCLIDRPFLMGKWERVPVICNPFTGQHLTLPKVKAKNSDLRTFFGYDPINKQFKVLCMTVTNYRKQVNSKEHQVLTIGKGILSWRKIKCLFPHYPERKRDGICINGILYYVAKSDKTCLIASFDVMSEEFRLINMPKDFELTNISALVNFKGKLCAVIYSGSHGELWVLEHTKREKWSKHSFVSPNTDFEEVKATWATDNGEIAWIISHWKNPFYVFFYNLNSKSVRRVEIKGIDDRAITNVSVTSYVESVMVL